MSLWAVDRGPAVALGRRLGEDEARRRGEVGALRDQRVARAVNYAIWDMEGRPMSSAGRKPFRPDPKVKK